MITVLLTTYNSGELIKDSIKSILNQTFKDFELLVIDDGSNDETEKVVSSFVDHRIRYEKIAHVGRSKALNYGLKICKYEWIALIDADDIAHPKRLELQFSEKLKKNSIAIISCVYFLNEKILFKIDVSDLEFPKDLVLHQKFPNSVLFNKYFILENGGYNEKLLVAEDYELWLRIMDKANFIIIKDVLMFCRNSSNSLSRENITITNSTIYNIQESYYKNLESKFGIKNKKEQNFYNGWREFFFGSPKLARKYWLKTNFYHFNIKILLAFFIAFLSQKKIDEFKKTNIKLRLRYWFNKQKYKTKLFDIQRQLNEST